MKKALFTVETISAGLGEVLVYVEDPAGHREEVRHLRGPCVGQKGEDGKCSEGTTFIRKCNRREYPYLFSFL